MKTEIVLRARFAGPFAWNRECWSLFLVKALAFSANVEVGTVELVSLVLHRLILVLDDLKINIRINQLLLKGRVVQHRIVDCGVGREARHTFNCVGLSDDLRLIELGVGLVVAGADRLIFKDPFPFNFLFKLPRCILVLFSLPLIRLSLSALI